MDISNNLSAKLKEEYTSIYHGLSTKYDRYPEDQTEKEPDEIISQIIEDFYNIPAKVVMQDFSFELRRQNKFKIEIPDIPTYKIRFAIEEGSWIVLLRDYFRISIKEEFNRLLSLEDLIWGTDGFVSDDLAYYVLELIELSENWILPTFNYWRRNHDRGNIEDFAAIIIGTYHQTSLQRGINLFEGGKRLFESKLEKLQNLKELQGRSIWFSKANDFLELVESEDKTKEDNLIHKSVIITLALFQREHMNALGNKRKRENEKLMNGKFNWDEFNIYDNTEKEEFKEYIIEKLYLQEEEDPFQAGEMLLLSEIEIYGIDLDERDLIQKYHDKISKISYQEIHHLQEVIPHLLIQLKKDMIEKQTSETKSETIKKLDMWDSLGDTYTRLSRIDDIDVAKKILGKAVKGSYRILLDHKILPKDAILEIVKHCHQNEIITDEKFQDMSQEIVRIDNEFDRTLSLSTLDELMLDYIVSEIANI